MPRAIFVGFFLGSIVATVSMYLKFDMPKASLVLAISSLDFWSKTLVDPVVITTTLSGCADVTSQILLFVKLETAMIRRALLAKRGIKN